MLFDNGLWRLRGLIPEAPLILLPSWGAAIHRCQVGRSFFQGDQSKTTLPVSQQQLGRSWAPEVVYGCWRLKFRVDLEGWKGFIKMYCKTWFPLYPPEGNRVTHCALGSERPSRLAVSLRASLKLLFFFFLVSEHPNQPIKNQDFPPCYTARMCFEVWFSQRR